MLKAIIVSKVDNDTLVKIYIDDQEPVTHKVIGYTDHHRGIILKTPSIEFLLTTGGITFANSKEHRCAEHLSLQNIMYDIVGYLDGSLIYVEEEFYIDPIFDYVSVDVGSQVIDGLFTYKGGYLTLGHATIQITSDYVHVTDSDYINHSIPMDNRANKFRLEAKDYELTKGYFILYKEHSTVGQVVEVNRPTVTGRNATTFEYVISVGLINVTILEKCSNGLVTLPVKNVTLKARVLIALSKLKSLVKEKLWN